jgi:hypothetical protein
MMPVTVVVTVTVSVATVVVKVLDKLLLHQAMLFGYLVKGTNVGSGVTVTAWKLQQLARRELGRGKIASFICSAQAKAVPRQLGRRMGGNWAAPCWMKERKVSKAAISGDHIMGVWQKLVRQGQIFRASQAV